MTSLIERSGRLRQEITGLIQSSEVRQMVVMTVNELAVVIGISADDLEELIQRREELVFSPNEAGRFAVTVCEKPGMATATYDYLRGMMQLGREGRGDQLVRDPETEEILERQIPGFSEMIEGLLRNGSLEKEEAVTLHVHAWAKAVSLTKRGYQVDPPQTAFATPSEP